MLPGPFFKGVAVSLTPACTVSYKYTSTLISPKVGAISLKVSDSEIQILPTNDLDAPVGVLHYVFEVNSIFPNHGVFA